MTDRYAVFGNPIAHSQSPRIHQLFAEQCGQDMVYDKQQVAEDGFDDAVREFFASGGKGLNVTVPFKEDAYRFAAQLSERARRAGAVNTLALQDDGSVLGDNTDGEGLVSDIREQLGWPIAGQRVLILGAGGAVRGILGPLLAEKPQAVIIANRTVAKAMRLAKAFSKYGAVKAAGFEDLPARAFDLVINGTSASLGGDLPPLRDDLLAEGARCYDMMYGAEPTVFLRWAEAHGAAATADGLGMLVGQAAASFARWRGQRPQVTPVIRALRHGLMASP